MLHCLGGAALQAPGACRSTVLVMGLVTLSVCFHVLTPSNIPQANSTVKESKGMTTVLSSVFMRWGTEYMLLYYGYLVVRELVAMYMSHTSSCLATNM